MLPTQSKYPEYVADQLLTADNLNDAFDYLEEGERLTRANLIGIGIVCGLEVRTGTDANGAYVTITAGCGITSEGYLVEVPEQTYRRYKAYKPLTEITYDRFVTASPAAERFHLDELVLTSSGEGIQVVDDAFLQGKIVLLYVELLLKKAKNCDPESCDDKGSGITVTFRPLVVNAGATGIESLLDKNGVGTAKGGITLIHAHPLALPRIDVPATDMQGADEVLNAFYTVLQSSFPGDLAENIQSMGQALSGFLDNDYGAPAQQLMEQLTALGQGLNGGTLLQLPYYYDYLSDLTEAWNELRDTFEELVAECCPDSTRFPRHLLLGATDGKQSLKYRTPFIPSPATNGGSRWLARLRSLWARLCAMVANFDAPQFGANENGLRLISPLRITPSSYGTAPLSERAIPYYYDLRNGDISLFELWNEALTRRHRVNTILGYATVDIENALPQVQQPLRYDLEPYNFLRIEGASGRPYSVALRDIEQQIQQYRLPVEVIALRTGVGSGTEVFGPELDCYFEDLQLNYELVRREVEAVFGKTIEYLSSFEALPQDMIDSGFNQPRFAPFKQSLITIKQFFVTDLRDFMGSYQSFIALYTSIENEAQLIRENLSRRMGGDQAGAFFDKDFAEDLIDHLDNIVMCCEKGGLRAVYEQYARKAETLYGKLFFGDFIQDHPGIQHKAGVTIGGTFILVYTPPSRVINDNRFIRKEGDETNAAGADASAPETPEALPTAALANTNTKIISKRANGEHNIRKVVGDILLPENWAKRLEHEGSNALTEAAKGLPGGTVIADFFLPYRISDCCGDGVTFIVNDAEPPEKLSIEIEQTDFCTGTEKTVPVRGMPEGGELKGQGIQKSEDGKSFLFNPASIKLQEHEPMREVLLTYSKGNSRPVHATVRIYAKPVVDFGVHGTLNNSGVPINPIGGNDEFSGVVTFASLAKNAGHLEWSLDDGTQAQRGLQAKFDFSGMHGKRGVTLKGKNGICGDKITKQLTIVTPGVFIEGTEFCANTAARPVIEFHPKGGSEVYSSDATGVVFRDGDVFRFNPSLVNPSGEFFTEVRLYYNGPTGTLYQTPLKVYQPIGGAFIRKELQDDGATWNFSSGGNYAQAWDWTFGPDGQKASGVNVSHQFPEEPGDYDVQAVVSNGPCSVTLQDKITVSKTRKVCLPLAAIVADFKKFDEANADKFKGSIFYTEVRNYFSALAEMGTNVATQVEQFTTMKAGEKLAEWLPKVSFEVGNFQASNRAMFVQLYSLLLRTVFYISCIQNADIKDARINVLTALQNAIAGIKNDWLKAFSGFSAEDKKAVAALAKAVQQELEQVKTNGEDVTKPVYFDLLTQLLNALKSLK